MKPVDYEIKTLTLILFLWINNAKIMDWNEEEKEFVNFIYEKFIDGSIGLINDTFLPGDISSLRNGDISILEVKKAKGSTTSNYNVDSSAFESIVNIVLSNLAMAEDIFIKSSNAKIKKDVAAEKVEIAKNNVKAGMKIYATKEGFSINEIISKIESETNSFFRKLENTIKRYYGYLDSINENIGEDSFVKVNNQNEWSNLLKEEFFKREKYIKNNDLLINPDSKIFEWNEMIIVDEILERHLPGVGDQELRSLLRSSIFLVLFNFSFEEISDNWDHDILLENLLKAELSGSLLDFGKEDEIRNILIEILEIDNDK